MRDKLFLCPQTIPLFSFNFNFQYHFPDEIVPIYWHISYIGFFFFKLNLLLSRTASRRPNSLCKFLFEFPTIEASGNLDNFCHNSKRLKCWLICMCYECFCKSSQSASVNVVLAYSVSKRRFSYENQIASVVIFVRNKHSFHSLVFSSIEASKYGARCTAQK